MPFFFAVSINYGCQKYLVAVPLVSTWLSSTYKWANKVINFVRQSY